ncbi:hypothetical protein [Pedobacter paludis]|uniref:Lipoprotein n=1 Tax=Pedobacter paludis TaxID=2203212 RepID=A0A317F273_9SPHI|nr:hypothetical protein [Pedobacter paludis]PWS31556.1 hypothetical protein DF947_13275 [Pedobacter paludis]
MKILLLFAFPIIFIACSPPKVKNQNKTETAVIAIKNFEKSLKKTDTGYKAITLKINQQDSILLKRIYFDKKDYSNYNYAFIRNGKTIYLDKKYKFIEDSKYNRLIKNGQKIFLFLEIDDRPNFNRIVAYSLFKDSLTFLVDCVYNDKKTRRGTCPIY